MSVIGKMIGIAQNNNYNHSHCAFVSLDSLRISLSVHFTFLIQLRLTSH